ncbi:protein-S-isoprenylcysteine O-methyltransferase Ste14 [Sphingomonas sp. PP-F2F-G114-C0414]|uniref:methyltransferase family protein n=1 Tax=Sphingomonas sp. PP-F2F-G114-C0414 TaxID=2135662 RepID=UPI000EF874C0|nr:isoprenylcysteine carboxylmethyltransferase family protein [Sphingomonas sp. PP-F2F-G114-C0414]RMB36804.1 protein-S-isoprenylcysteine O-methyltransferase Ste14 [Sphingomonas sp. PP-F2F-G114-C0414]
MDHDDALSARPQPDPRPRSAVSGGAGLCGLIGIFVWLGIARWYGLDGPYSALVNVVACALPMVAWSLIVDKVHRNASTGIDWSAPRPLRTTLDTSLTKLAGLWATWAAIAVVYGTVRSYWQGNFAFAMWCFTNAAPILFVASIPYVLWIDRHLIEPRDGAWHLGGWMTGQAGVDPEAIYGHLRAWGVKTFFLAFMLAIVPPGFASFVRGDLQSVLHDPVALANWLITFMFLIDVAFATVGYILTFRPLDSHIRSANPFAAAWMAALMCYPPFILMNEGGPLDYHPGTSDWAYWFQGHPVLLALVGAVLVALTAIYAWATMAFGFRFSNLTNRGILTHGPYAISRHPAYLSKNLFWWISTIPILTTGSIVDAARATLLLAAVGGVYFWRAKTEERHLKLDPDYRAYFDWMTRNGLVPRLFARLRG